MKASEKALREYCDPAVVEDYDRLAPSEKKVMLDAFIATQRDNLLSFALKDGMDGGGMAGGFGAEPLSKKNRPNLKDPLVKSVQDSGLRVDVIKQKHFEECKARMESWGIPTSNHERILRYQQLVQVQKAQSGYQNQEQKDFLQTNKSVIKRSDSSADWATLKRIDFREVTLFKTNRKAFIEGKIIGEAIKPSVGGTVLVQDARGDVMLVCFYNYIQAEIRGKDAEPILKKKFPMGATLRVAEPFMKIFRDGSRGIRVDDPTELQVVGTSTTSNGSVQEVENELLRGKKRANKYVAKKQYDTAMDIYLDSLRSCSFVPTLLSNRAQAFISLEKYEQGLLDAAASLTIRPTCKKTWARYDLCLEKLRATLETTDESINHLLLKGILDEGKLTDSLASNKKPSSPVDVKLAEKHKADGNGSFKKQHYDEAIYLYTEALLAGGGTVRAILSNWALCALEIGAKADVIAAATASIRIAVDEKAFYRLSTALTFLGHYDLSLQVIEAFPTSLESASLSGLRDHAMDASQVLRNIEDGTKPEKEIALNLLGDCPSHLGNWTGACETFQTKKKGRGMRALAEMEEGAVILIERPLLHHETNAAEDGFVFSASLDSVVDSTSTVRQAEITVLRCKRDGVLSRFLNRLSDGSKQMPLVSVTSLLMTVDAFPLLLPGHHEYFRSDGQPQLSAAKIRKILDVNQHGSGRKISDTESSSTLFPTLSMMNHSSDPTCMFLPTKGSTAGPVIVVAKRRVRKGEEFTMKYHESKAALSKWKIDPGS